ncbi:hypothetical protein K438DRAFT_1778831 [Mycena galopus ATCC 62051]|nr:hypothetical protein K438DRAFT_1778831 [Mycena galopus ATCC 62051]
MDTRRPKLSTSRAFLERLALRNAGGEASVDRPAVKKYSLWSCGEAACWATCTQQTDLVVESRTLGNFATPRFSESFNSPGQKFPNEIWQEVFSYLPLDALRNLSSTHKSPSQRQLDDALERLRFWSSPEMAPYGRSCTAIVKWHTSSQWHILTDSFFEFLPTFTGLRRLHLDRIRFTQKVIVDLCGLTKLSYAKFNQCTVQDGEHLDPDLQAYTGPSKNLGLFVQRTTLTHITLSQCRFLQLVTELRGVKALPNITSLTVCFDFFETAGIDALFRFFPNLTKIRLTFLEDSGEFDPEPASVVKMLPSSSILPRTLESIYLSWCESSDGEYNEEDMPYPPDPAELPDFARLRDTVIAKCPALTYIFLDGLHFLFEWWKSSLLVREFTAYSYDEAKALRAKTRKTGSLL